MIAKGDRFVVGALLVILSASACTQLLGVDFEGRLAERSDGGPGEPDPTLDGSADARADGTTGDAGPSGTPLRGDGVSAGGAHACALTDGDGIACWGWNKHGQLGNGTITDAHTAAPVSTLTAGVSMVAAGGDFTCAVKNAAAYCWGAGRSGQIGNGAFTDQRKPVMVTGLSTAVLGIGAGLGHACAVIDSGVAPVVCWGRNDAGQLGDGTTLTASSSPVSMETVGGGVTAVALGDNHSCALTKYGTVWCWGSNAHGKLGNGPGPDRAMGSVVKDLGNVVAISAGAQHTCALTGTKKVFCWGSNEFSQLGDGTTTDQTRPQEITTIVPTVVSVATGLGHSCVTYSKDGVTHCWGENTNGGLGDALTTPKPTAGNSEALTAFPVARVSAGVGFTCANAAGKTRVACWGWNKYGQVGSGTTTDSLVPTDVLVNAN